MTRVGPQRHKKKNSVLYSGLFNSIVFYDIAWGPEKACCFYHLH
jgi:hypothetical protein